MPTANDTSASLITPDLWLKNCTSPRDSDKSRSASPSSELLIDAPVACHPFNIYPPKSQSNLISSNAPSVRNREIHAAKFSKKPTKKKKKLQKMRVSLLARDLTKKGERPFPSSLESPTPKISFQPNFSSMLPSESESPQQSRHVSADSSDIKPTVTKVVSSKSFCSGNPPIPPLLPINKSCELSATQNSRSTTITATATTSTVSSPTSLLRSSDNSLLPFPTVLLPYPILLPIILPVPIPIPIPISETRKQTTQSDEYDNPTLDKNNDESLDN